MSTPLSQPPAHHTDQCIRDAVQYGFCDHTRLTTHPRTVREHDITVFTLHRARDITGWLALALITASQALLFLTAPLWLALVTTPLQALGWSGLFAAGLPSPLSADHSRSLPLDVQARFRILPPYRPNRFHPGRSRKPKPKGRS